MNIQKFVILLLSLVATTGVGCGVKGDPRPPLKSVDIGRGRPAFKGALNVDELQKSVDGAEEQEEEAPKKRRRSE